VELESEDFDADFSDDFSDEEEDDDEVDSELLELPFDELLPDSRLSVR
jgi:hypothetical protein